MWKKQKYYKVFFKGNNFQCNEKKEMDEKNIKIDIDAEALSEFDYKSVLVDAENKSFMNSTPRNFICRKHEVG